MEDWRGRSGGTTAAARPSGFANGTHLRNLQMQPLPVFNSERLSQLKGFVKDKLNQLEGFVKDKVLLVFNAERLNQLKGFVKDKGPELMGDLIGPWAKWALILLNTFVPNDTDGFVQRYIAPSVLGMQNPHPNKSPLQIVVSSLRAAAEEALEDAQFMADLRTGAARQAILLMLVRAIADLGWKMLVCLHAGVAVAHMNLPFIDNNQAFLFQAVHIFLYALNAVAPNSFCQLLLAVAGSVFAISLQSFRTNIPDMGGLMFLTSAFLIFFLTSFWFGLCVVFAIFVRISDDDQFLSAFMFVSLCAISLGKYASGGAFGGGLLVFLCPIVLLSCRYDLNGLCTPLRLVLVSMLCLFLPFWIGLVLSILVFYLVAADDNAKAFLWWFFSFPALHLLAYAFSRNCSVIIVCFIGSYFSYGCIL